MPHENEKATFTGSFDILYKNIMNTLFSEQDLKKSLFYISLGFMLDIGFAPGAGPITFLTFALTIPFALQANVVA